jgi:hypothetical protein
VRHLDSLAMHGGRATCSVAGTRGISCEAPIQ